MKSVITSLSILTLLVGYVYTLLSVHIVLARIDEKINIPRRSSGEIKINDLKEFAAKLDVYEYELKKAIYLLTLNNYVTYLLSILFFFFILMTKTAG